MAVVSILTLFSLFACSTVYGAEIPMDVGLHTGDWDEDSFSPLGSTLGFDDNGSLTIVPYEFTTLSISPAPEPSSGQIWITISPFAASLSGQKTNLVAGYLSGDRTGATLTIAGKKPSDTDFSDITTIKPDENGLFIWAVPAGQKDVDLFRVTAKSGSTQVQSNAIRFTAVDEQPIVQPVVVPAST
ncbi:MAG: hypothetical protein V1862_10260 [Methanobacteriota archaeon]